MTFLLTLNQVSKRKIQEIINALFSTGWWRQLQRGEGSVCFPQSKITNQVWNYFRFVFLFQRIYLHLFPTNSPSSLSNKFTFISFQQIHLYLSNKFTFISFQQIHLHLFPTNSPSLPFSKYFSNTDRWSSSSGHQWGRRLTHRYLFCNSYNCCSCFCCCFESLVLVFCHTVFVS